MNEFISLYEREFAAYNKVHNISRLSDIALAAKDSLLACEFVDFAGLKVADIGSGAGFPALFLAYANPEAEFVLFEPNYKKAAFLTSIKIKANLANVQVKALKVQDYKPLSDQRFDLVISRAFASAEILVKLCAHLGDESLRFVLYKGSLIDQELSCLKDYKLHKYPKRIFLDFTSSDLL